jgi:hypothetical protein
LLRLSVPDFDASLHAYHETGDAALLRHLLGPRNSERGYHLVGYTKPALRAIVEAHGFRFVDDEVSPHAYPALCCIWRRSFAS